MSVAVSVRRNSLNNSDEAAEARHADLRARAVETLALTDRRGYGVAVEAFARLFYQGAVAPEEILPVLRSSAGMAVVDGLVVRLDRVLAVREMLRRQAAHTENGARAEALAADFAGRLLATCPLVRSVCLTGSAASGGFDPSDDVDLNLIVRDGAKYTVYLWSLALS